MKGLIIETANFISFEALATKIKQKTEDFLADPTNDEAKLTIGFLAAVWTTKEVLIRQYNSDASQMHAEFEKFDHREQIFNPNQN